MSADQMPSKKSPDAIGNSIYIDDNQANVDAAAQLGFDALFFSSPTRLAADLLERGALQLSDQK